MALRSVAASLPPSLSKFVAAPVASQLSESAQPQTLYETLSRLPADGRGTRVFQTRWQSKGIQGCYWEVTRVRLKDGGKHGKAWGQLVWRGRPVSGFKEERIRGALKYKWMEGVSKGNKLKVFPPEPVASAASTPTSS